ncbi:hypothetical protein [Phytohabitans rumicis]|uniref:hypothetical protein n=1 Tax=Phytohabitans rumicis TaxID=1076125 RepID=UPI001566DB88|nr:hypothetical protein [Phytohabitans rumicis]
MRDVAVYAETLAFLVVLPGFVTLVVLAPLRRVLLRAVAAGHRVRDRCCRMGGPARAAASRAAAYAHGVPAAAARPAERGRLGCGAG